MDLFKDVANALRGQLMELGYDVSHVQGDDHGILMLYSKVQRYSIEQRPRSIRKSAYFECPTQYVLGLQRLEQAIQAGDNLTPYRSRSVESTTKLDGLLDYWRIYHFHLGVKLEKDGFVERTDGLLFCLFDIENAYLLKVGNHYPFQWTEKELVQIIHQNWPELLESFRVKGITKLANELSDGDLRELRSANGLTFLNMADGTIYIEPGIGRTTGGLHIDDLMWADKIRRVAEKIETQITNNWPQIVNHAGRQGYCLTGTDDLILMKTVFDYFWDIRDPASGYRFRQYAVF